MKLKFQVLRDLQQSMPYVTYNYPDVSKTNELQMLQQNVDLLKERLQYWYSNVRYDKQRFITKMRSGYLHPLYEQQAPVIADIEHRFKDIYNALLADAHFALPEICPDTIVSKMKMLAAIKTTLERADEFTTGYVNDCSSLTLHPQYADARAVVELGELRYRELLAHVSQDKMLILSEDEPDNHYHKIRVCGELIRQLQAYEAIEASYLARFSSRSLHKCYLSLQEAVAASETRYEEWCSLLYAEQLIKRSGIAPFSHSERIKECDRLIAIFSDCEVLVNRYVYRFSSHDIHVYYTGSADAIEHTEKQFVEGCSRELHKVWLAHALPPALTHPAKLEELDRCGTILSEVERTISDFRLYYPWRRFFINLSGFRQEIVTVLINSGPEDWVTAFTGWYHYWLLSLNDSSELPRNEDWLGELQEAKEALKHSQVYSILEYWKQKQHRSIMRMNRMQGSVRTLYNQRGAAGHKRNSLRKIIRSDIEFFTDFFPVLMVSPSTCSSILPLKEGLFDLVLFDEASQLRIEDTFPALMRGKIKVVSGDSRQMPPPAYFQGGVSLLNPGDDDLSDDMADADTPHQKAQIDLSMDLADCESLLDYAETTGFKPSLLMIHYRSRHPHLIDFSNHAFYGKRLIPMPAKQAYTCIQYIDVQGSYEDQTNKDEALRVVDIILNHINPFSDGTYPSVGVATFNLYQRNLIMEEIAKLRQLNSEYDRKFSDLGSTFFVKNLENIQGDERDIIILSTTFGRKPSGSFSQNFGPISNKTKGYKLLNVIITRAKYKLYVCSSIPNDYLQHYKQQLGSDFSGNSIFYAYLAYAKSISEGDSTLTAQILSQVHAGSPYQSTLSEYDEHSMDVSFEQEIYTRLAAQLGSERVTMAYRVGGFTLDLVVRPLSDDRPLLAIECDGTKHHDSKESYVWDLFRKTQLENNGFVFHRIWSVNWLNDPEGEFENLLALIAKVDCEDYVRENSDMALIAREDFDIAGLSNAHGEKRIGIDSRFVVKTPEGKLLRMRLSNTVSKQPSETDAEGYLTLQLATPMGQLFLSKAAGDICQLGMLEYYYEVVEVD